MYSATDVRQALSNPRLAVYELNRLFHRRGYTRECNERGIDIFEEDWDALCILDACRFDMFEQHHTLPGKLSWRESQGSNTVEFLRGNVSGKELLDTVYVTANPQFYQHRKEFETTFHAVINIWQEEGWHDELGTVLPETTTEYAKRARDRYPNKRLLVHYLQPHYPFIEADTAYDKGQLEDPDDTKSFWRQMRMDELDVPTEQIWDDYVDNLKVVFPHIRELLETLEGRTVVTSDHGNMVGERCGPVPIRGWGHPIGIYTDQLVKVPWLVSENGQRPTITADPVDDRADVEQDVVEERLQQLGYKQ